MKFLRQGIALAVVGAGLAAIPAMQAQAQAAEPSLVQQIRGTANGAVEFGNNAATGKVGFAAVTGATSDLLPGVNAKSGAEAATKATAFLDKYGVAFGAAKGQLEQSRVANDQFGWTVTYTQQYQGVDVFGSMIKANIDKDGDLTSVNGFAAPGLNLSTSPRLSGAEAGKRSVAIVKGSPADAEDGSAADTTGVKAVSPKLVVYRIGLVKGEPGETVLAYETEVTNKKNIRDMVYLDANTGKPVNRYSMVADALDRELYEATGTEQAPVLTKVWEEGDAFPGALNIDQQNLVNSSGESYWMYSNAFGRDSYDGAGAPRLTVNNDPRISCPNANWNGITTNYCNGVTSDDVVAHEWGHAYTEYTSGLIYQYQSGALNESYSDVWGETLDLINDREDEDEGDITAKRPDGLCSTHTRSNIGAVINSPAPAAGPCAGATAASFGPVFDAAGTTADVVVALDEANPEGPTVNDGCTPFTNAGAVAGKWAYVDRGTCPFTDKIANAEDAGATGIVFGNTVAGAMTSVTGVSDIYGLMVTNADGTTIKTAGAVNMTVKDIDTDQKADSFRWLIGEKAEAFGGAIRDMWNPTCYGDPGKVTDAEYDCDPDLADGGGVHGNSAVPNHAYALAVDGGTYNGTTVAGLGLDKAAAIWWRAQTAYLTPASNFSNAADALEQSCVDVTGQPINQLTTAPNATPVAATPVAAGDCASITAAIAATQMRTPPTQCAFTPLLAKGAPSVCGDGFTSETVWSEDFEDGLAGWTPSSEVVFDGGLHDPWTAGPAPVGAGDPHPSTVVYGPATDRGDCAGGTNDYSSRDSITGPIIELPNNLRAPRMSFEHYVATEAGYDGGNVKVSVNDGTFQAIPAAAYTFNAPGKLATVADQNTNPLAGEDGFTGTDGGESQGSWGESQVDVSALGVGSGDTVQFRFDIGRDGCGGIEGWYVDNVKLVQCKLATKLTAVHAPEPSTAGQASSVNVTVARDGSVGGTPTGDVTLKKADGSTVGTATLANGTASIAVPTTLAAGVYPMAASYAGDDTLAGSTANVTVTIKAGPGTPPTSDSSTNLKVRPKHPKYTKNIKGVAKVKADNGTDVTGKVRFRLDGKKIGTKSLDNGRVVLKIKKNIRIGKHKLVAIYMGSDTIERSRDKVKFKVKRR